MANDSAAVEQLPSVPLPSLQWALDHHELSIIGGLPRPEDMAESGGTNRD